MKQLKDSQMYIFSRYKDFVKSNQITDCSDIESGEMRFSSRRPDRNPK